MIRPRARDCSVLSLVAFASLASCAATSDEGHANSPIIYDQDDRQDLYAHPDTALREVVRRSIVAFMPAASVDQSNPSNVRLIGGALGDVEVLCAGERFFDQPAVAECSGTLIADDLVLTEGHCLPRDADCPATRIVFGYYYDAPGVLHPITNDDVFRCAEVLVRANGNVGSQVHDYAIARLDRSATPRFAPVRVSRSVDAIATGRRLAVIGFGSGVPAKIDTGAIVIDPRAAALDYFYASSDTFPGNSGSAVLDRDTRVLVGTLMGGEGEDYVQRGDCWVVNHCVAPPCPGEQINYVHHAIQALCATGSSSRLCRATVCGDMTCDADETAASCPVDCANNQTDGGVSIADASDAADVGSESGMPPTAGCGCRSATGHEEFTHSSHALIAAIALGFAIARRRLAGTVRRP